MHSRMNEFQINVTINLAVVIAGYVVGTALIAAACLGLLDDPFGDLGVACLVFGAVRRVAGWLGEMEKRETNAFEIGRDFEAGRVRKIP